MELLCQNSFPPNPFDKRQSFGSILSFRQKHVSECVYKVKQLTAACVPSAASCQRSHFKFDTIAPSECTGDGKQLAKCPPEVIILSPDSYLFLLKF
jgi:hypothetical protein